MDYKNVEIWKMVKDLTVSIHNMSFSELPEFEDKETGRLIRKSIKSARTYVVESLVLEEYQSDCIRYLNYSLASTYETIDLLETLFETKSLMNPRLFKALMKKLQELSLILEKFIENMNQQNN